MTVVAVWCRHIGDNLIGIGNQLPWHVPSDLERFRKIVEGQFVVCGRKTYESLPNRIIEGCRLFVMTSTTDYEVSDKAYHHVVSSQKMLADIEEDLYIAGGADIYHLFMTGKEKLKPHIVVDCVYQGNIAKACGEHICIDESMKVLEKDYRKISADYLLDDVVSSIWIKKGEFVEQSVLKRLLRILEEGEVMQ